MHESVWFESLSASLPSSTSVSFGIWVKSQPCVQVKVQPLFINNDFAADVTASDDSFGRSGKLELEIGFFHSYLDVIIDQLFRNSPSQSQTREFIIFLPFARKLLAGFAESFSTGSLLCLCCHFSCDHNWRQFTASWWRMCEGCFVDAVCLSCVSRGGLEQVNRFFFFKWLNLYAKLYFNESALKISKMAFYFTSLLQ